MAWKAQASTLLELLTQDELIALHKFYWHREDQPSSRPALIEEILAKESKPSSLLSRQQISVDLMRRYLGVTKGPKADLRIQIAKAWTGEDGQPIEIDMDIPPPEESQSSHMSASASNMSASNMSASASNMSASNMSASKSSSGKKRASTSDAGPPAKSSPPLDMHRWWIVRTDDGIHYSGLVDGQLKDTGLVVEDRDQDVNGPVEWGMVVDASGQRYRLKDPLDGHIITKRSDMFGPWPEPMVGGDAVHQQLARNLSALSADMRVRLTEGMGRERIMPMQMNGYLYRLLQIINGLACRETLLSEAKKLPSPPPLVPKAKTIPPESYGEWAARTGLDEAMINELESLNSLFEQIKEKATRVHEMLYFKDRHKVLENSVHRAGPGSVAAAVNRRKFRVLESAEQRAGKSREETQEKKAREKNATEAQKREMKAQEIRDTIESLMGELESMRRDEQRLFQVRTRLNDEHAQLQNEIKQARDRMAQAITTAGSAFPRELFAELQLLERTLAAVETDMSALQEQLDAVQGSSRELQRSIDKARGELAALA